MKKLLTNKKLMSMLSLVLVVTMMITNINLGGVRAKATETNTNMLSLTKKVTSKGNDKYEVDLETKGRSIKSETTKATDVVLVIDKSSSMYGTKLASAKEAAKQFVNTVTSLKDQEVRVTVVAYGNSAETFKVEDYSFAESTPKVYVDAEYFYIDKNKTSKDPNFKSYTSNMGNVQKYKKILGFDKDWYVKDSNGGYVYGNGKGNKFTQDNPTQNKGYTIYDGTQINGNKFIKYDSRMGNDVVRYDNVENKTNYYHVTENGAWVYGKATVGTKTDLGFSSDATKIKAAIDSITTTQSSYGSGIGTNTQAGLAAAENLFEGNNTTNKVVILLSDGAATYSQEVTAIDLDRKVTSFNSPTHGGGSDFELQNPYWVSNVNGSNGLTYYEDDYYYDENGIWYYYYENKFYAYISDNGQPAILQAQNIKNKGAKIYTIGYCDNSADLTNTMKKIASSEDKFKNAPNVDDIKSTFENIAKEISYTSVPKGTFTDLVPAYFDVVDGQNNVVENGTFVVDGNTIEVEKLADGSKKVTSEVTNLTNPADENEKKTNVKFNIVLNRNYIKTHALEYVNLKQADGTYKFATNLEVAPGQYAKVDYEKSTGTAGSTGSNETAYAGAKFTADLKLYNVTVNYYKDSKSEENKLGSKVYGVYFAGETSEFGDLYFGADQKQFTGNATVNNATKVSNGNYKITNIQSDKVVDVIYEVKTFTVKYYNGVSTTSAIRTETVKYGENAKDPITAGETTAADLVAAKAASDPSKNFAFTGWDKDGKNITTNTAITALFNGTAKTFTVRFFANQGDAQPFATKTGVVYGNTVEAPEGTPADITVGLDPNVDRKVFDGWNFVFDTPITSDTDIYATYKDVYKTYTVQFVGLDGQVITTATAVNVAYGTEVGTASAPSITGDYRDDSKVYFFNGWDKTLPLTITDEVADSTRTVTITAKNSNAPRYYTVRWLNNEGEVLQSNDRVEYGSSESYTGNDPEYQLAPTDNAGEYTHTFTGWDKGTNGTVSNVTANVDVTAQYSHVLNKYTYTFVYWDAEGKPATDPRENVEWGKTLTPPDVPSYVTTAPGIEYTHSFASWSDDAWRTGVKADNLIATASESVLTKYLVTFVYANGTKEVLVEAGKSVPATEIPSGDTVKKNSDNKYTYEFDGWNGNVASAINAPTTFTAQYKNTEIEYKLVVKYMLDNETTDEVFKTYVSSFGAIITTEAPDNAIVRNGKKYHFVGFTNEVVTLGTALTVTEYVKYEEDPKFEVVYHSTLVDYDKESLEPVYTTQTAIIGKSEKVYADGALSNDAAAVAEAEKSEGKLNAKYTVEFEGWVNADGSAFTDTKVTANKDVYAKYKVVINKYTVTFVDFKYDSDDVNSKKTYTTVSSIAYDYGTAAVRPTLTKSDDTAKFTYGDPTWDIAESVTNNVTSDLVVKANHPRTLRSYDVIFENYDGSYLGTIESVPYGGTIDGYKEPTRDDSDYGHFFYVFDGWTVNGTKVDFPYTVYGTTTMAAVYTKHEHTFSVAFIDSKPDGTTLNFDCGEIIDTVVWGQSVSTPVAIQAKEAAEGSAEARSNKVYTWQFTGFKELVVNEDGTTSFGADFSENAEIKADVTYVATYSNALNAYNFVYLNDKVEEAELPDVVTKSQIKEFVFAEDLTDAGAYETTPAAVRADGPAKGSTNTENFTFIGWKLFAGTVVDDDLTPAPVAEPIDDETPTPVPDQTAVSGDRVASVRRVAHITLDASSLADAPDADDVVPVLENVYVFETLDDLTQLVRGLKFVASEVYLVPVYASSVRTYKVDFVDYDGQVLKSEQVEFEKAATAPANPSRSGYTFTGWDKDFSKVTTDLTVNAKYQANGGGYYFPPTPDPIIETGDDQTPQGSTDQTPNIIIDGDDDETPQGTAPDGMELTDDDQALGDALVKTGTVPVAVYYGFGATLMLAAMYLAFRKKREEA